ncbi:MAG: hypothetical protein JRF70_10320, partial [Deltaproteobacteria bacterium]|nr:hypothetical protein [Deltaproteobacteria bacterium]
LPSRLPRALAFYGAIQGSPLARTTVLDPRDVTPYTAGVLVGIFGLAVGVALRRRRDARLWDRWLPWLAMGGYAVVTCAAVGIGRSALNKWSYGLVPHYLTVSTYLLLADVVLVGLVVEDLLKRTRRPLLRAALPRVLALGAGALLAFQSLQWGIGVAGMREWKSARLQSRTAMLYLNHFEPQYLRRVSEELKDATKLVNRLNDVGYFVPPLLPDTRLCHFGIDESPLAEADAKLTRIKRAGAALIVEGYARLPEARRRADGVLLTVRDEAGRLVVAEHVELRGVPYAAIPESDHRFSGAHIPGVETFAGFRGKIPFARLADRDPLRIQAWAVDSQRMVVRPFAQHVVLSAGPRGRRAELRNGPGPAVEGGGPGCGSASP